jgi:hypothetical protein
MRRIDSSAGTELPSKGFLDPVDYSEYKRLHMSMSVQRNHEIAEWLQDGIGRPSD